jgi:hypothetical protein
VCTRGGGIPFALRLQEHIKNKWRSLEGAPLYEAHGLTTKVAAVVIALPASDAGKHAQFLFDAESDPRATAAFWESAAALSTVVAKVHYPPVVGPTYFLK